MQLKVNIYEFSYSYVDYPDNSDQGALTVYFCGCSNNCPGCHNEELKNPNLGTSYTTKELEKYLKELSKRFLNCKRVVLLGGDPLFKDNIDFVTEFLINTKFEVTLFTGKTYNELKDSGALPRIIGRVEYLKTGRYDLTKRVVPEKTSSYYQLSSTNQEIYDKHLKLISSKGRVNYE